MRSGRDRLLEQMRPVGATPADSAARRRLGRRTLSPGAPRFVEGHHGAVAGAARQPAGASQDLGHDGAALQAFADAHAALAQRGAAVPLRLDLLPQLVAGPQSSFSLALSPPIVPIPIRTSPSVHSNGRWFHISDICNPYAVRHCGHEFDDRPLLSSGSAGFSSGFHKSRDANRHTPCPDRRLRLLGGGEAGQASDRPGASGGAAVGWAWPAEA